MNIRIEWLSDSSDCDTCGGSYAEGARVLVDGNLALELTPEAHCFGDVSWSPREVYALIFRHLGHAVEEVSL